MSKKKGKTPQPAAKTITASAPKMEAFTFGEPVPVLDRRDILDYVECISNGRWYEPPVSFTGLAKSLRAAVHHSSPIYVKRNILASTFIPHPWLSQQDFSRFVLDFLVFGNAFLEKRYSTTGKVIRLETSPAKYTRRGVEEDVYWWVPSFNEPTPFAPGSVFHLLEPDINQELYGLPEYLSALNSAWLNESATLFRRKYYENGAHAGYIMYVTDAVQDRNDIEMLRENMVKSKGRNNFKNLFLTGAPGLGKTFLSACIARSVSEQGFSVVYDTAGNIFAQFENRKFQRDAEGVQTARDETRRYLNCDLLILDDLGSELTTQFTQSALYELINTRLVSDRRTVISSNLTPEDVVRRYTPQISSRLLGEFYILHFFGDDIRLLKRK